VAYIWSLDRQQQLIRLIVAPPMIQACEDRRDFWTMLRSIARQDRPEVTRESLTEEIRQEISQRILNGFARWLGELDGTADGLR
jgi:pyruvate-ferredoxin/flavodoxin oxidoreductase